MGNSEFYMRRCLELAQKAKGHTAPNPMVGAVLVHNGRTIGEGWHHYYGADHAEVNCLKNVAAADRHLVPESTMYVNLEPCAHYGITPPCANKLADEKVKKVVIANTDLFEKVSGKGIGILQQANVNVSTGISEKEAAWMNRRFFCFHKNKRPYIILKWAQTKDGYIAPADRSRFQITGAESQKVAHKWRTEEAAIMVGFNTAMNDNPRLTSRLWEGQHPLRITLDRKLTLPKTHYLFDDTAATWIVNDKEEILDGNVHDVKIRFDDQLLPNLLRKLYDTKILSLIVEGGAQLLNSFIQQGLWDEARVFTGNIMLNDGIKAPSITGGNAAFSEQIGEDMLEITVNQRSEYPYAGGMEL